MDDLILRLQMFGGWLVGAVGVVLASISAWDLVDAWDYNQTVTSYIASGYVLVLVTVAFGFMAFRQYQTIRKEKYANITPHLHSISHILRDLQTFLDEQRPEEGATKDQVRSYRREAKRKFVQVLDELANIFRTITSTHCRASIKLLYPGEHAEELYFWTYARDQRSEEECRDRDQWRIRNNHDALNKNKRFAQLFSKDETLWHYMSNNLASDASFSTTSMTAYKPDHADSIPNGVRALFSRRWPLPYRSTLSCAIRQGSFDLHEERQSTVVGFLTVDSESRGVFVEKWDIQLIFSVADALFRPLNRLNDVNQEYIQTTKNGRE